jgi:hypothetical protein
LVLRYNCLLTVWSLAQVYHRYLASCSILDKQMGCGRHASFIIMSKREFNPVYLLALCILAGPIGTTWYNKWPEPVVYTELLHSNSEVTWTEPSKMLLYILSHRIHVCYIW